MPNVIAAALRPKITWRIPEYSTRARSLSSRMPGALVHTYLRQSQKSSFDAIRWQPLL